MCQCGNRALQSYRAAVVETGLSMKDEKCQKMEKKNEQYNFFNHDKFIENILQTWDT
jgi:hypothetical protein